MATLALSKEDQIRTSITRAAQQLFQQYGLHKVTMEDIARAMGKGKSSLYYYFKSKEEIFEVMLGRELDEMLDIVEAAVGQAATTEEKLSAFYLTLFQEIRRRAGLNSVLAGEVIRDVTLVQRIRQRYRQRNSDLLRHILTVGSPAGEHPQLSPAELDALVFVLVTSLHGLAQDVVLGDDDSRLEPAVRTLSQVLLRGLSS